MKRAIIFLLLFFIFPCLPAQDYSRLVNPFIGTGGHGHTFPGATLPFGMVQLSPDTRSEGWDACGGYHYSDSVMLGFSHTHFSGTGVADYGDILIMPSMNFFLNKKNSTIVRRSEFNSSFSHVKETASPGFYRVFLEKDQITAELTATERTGIHRYTFLKNGSADILFDLVHGLGPDVVIESSLRQSDARTITGMRRSSGWAKDQIIFFAAEFSEPIKNFTIITHDTLRPGIRQASGNSVQGIAQFPVFRGKSIVIKVGISFVDAEGAILNVRREASGKDFGQLKAGAQKKWDDRLRVLSATGGSPSQQTVFYTALYHSLICPNISSDADGRYRGMDNIIRTQKEHPVYSVFSLWDTFRALNPLLTIVEPAVTRDIIRSLLLKYDQSGLLPVWEFASNETWCMIGYHAIPVIADAYAKGITDFDAGKALKAMIKSASADHFGLQSYRRFGFIPGNADGESVSKTLEYAYDDWCIAQTARLMKKNGVYHEYMERSQYYKNVFDPATGFMRAKENNAWVTPFDPAAVTVHYTEANAWQYSFFVPHDIDGLTGLMGGRNNFCLKLDSLFFGSSKMAGRDQSDITGLIGQYAHGNEPSHHAAYLYTAAGQPWKTQMLVRKILDSLYLNRPDGLCGNDDCGQMSAWYVMSALGFYSLTPGSPEYTLTSPLFPKAVINLPNKKTFTITAASRDHTSKYIRSYAINKKIETDFIVKHHDILRGGLMKIELSPDPDYSFTGIAISDEPPSIPITSVPYLSEPMQSFRDSALIFFMPSDAGSVVHYTLDGKVPTASSLRFDHPIVVHSSVTVNAIAIHPRKIPSRVVTSHFKKIDLKGSVALAKPPSDQYAGGGKDGLFDGLRGGPNFRLGAWQGFWGDTIDAVVDLGEVRKIQKISLGCLQDIDSWIFFPDKIIFSFSADGVNYADSLAAVNDLPAAFATPVVKDFGVTVHREVRFIRVRAYNRGFCPSWHKGAGNKAWIFADEVMVE